MCVSFMPGGDEDDSDNLDADYENDYNYDDDDKAWSRVTDV